MAGSITRIRLCDEPLPIRTSCATYCACLVRARRGQNDASVAHPAEYFLGGAPVISGPVQEGVGRFVATRQVAGHPIAVSRWERQARS